MSNSTRFKKLFEPGRIGAMEVKNRIVLAPMATQLHDDDGYVTEQMNDYHETRARGGAGIITIAALSISFPIGSGHKAPGRLDDDRFIPKMSELNEVVHRHGAKTIAQLLHMGPADAFPVTTETQLQPLAASAISRQPDFSHPKKSIVKYSLPKEMTVSEIAETIDNWAKAALRSKKAGSDGVEVHAANRYLLNSFLSPAWNRRTDKYGGDLKNRARFLLETIAAVRDAVGPDYPVWCRINGDEWDIDGGISITMVRELAPMLEAAGLSAINVSSMYPHSPGYAPGFNIPAAAAIKSAVKIPVVVAGRLTPQLGEQVLRQGKADYICLGRPLIADPELPNKAAAGKLEDVTPCIYCLNCLALDRKCTVNAARAKEREYEIKPADKPKKVVIVGGGPGGMEAARVAALRGHQVTLYEKESRLGGQMILASVLRAEIEPLLNYFRRQVKKLGVKVVTGKKADAALIAADKPDAVVVATGSYSVLPEIPGIDGDNVLGSGDIQRMMRGHLKRDGKSKTSLRRLVWFLGLNLSRAPFGLALLRWGFGLWAPFGRRIIIVGKGMPGIELADFMAQRGKLVTVVDTRDTLAYIEPPMPVLRQFMEDRFENNGGRMATAASYQWITPRGLTFINDQQQLQSLEGDTIMFASDYRPNDELAQALKGTSATVHMIGDCSKPIGIMEAIHDGSRVGREI